MTVGPRASTERKEEKRVCVCECVCVCVCVCPLVQTLILEFKNSPSAPADDFFVSSDKIHLLVSRKSFKSVAWQETRDLIPEFRSWALWAGQENRIRQEPLVAVEPRRSPVTNVGTETTFRHDHCKHFQKSKHLLGSVDAITGLHRPQKKHSPRSEFTPEIHRWISKLTARHLQFLHQEIFWSPW